MEKSSNELASAVTSPFSSMRDSNGGRLDVIFGLSDVGNCCNDTSLADDRFGAVFNDAESAAIVVVPLPV